MDITHGWIHRHLYNQLRLVILTKKTNTYTAWYQNVSSVSSHLWHLSWPTKNNCDYMTRTFFTFSHLLCQNVVDSLRCASWVHNILSIVMMRTHCRIRVHADHTKLHLELLISPEVMGCTASTLEGWGVGFVFKNWKFRVGEGRGVLAWNSPLGGGMDIYILELHKQSSHSLSSHNRLIEVNQSSYTSFGSKTCWLSWTACWCFKRVQL